MRKHYVWAVTCILLSYVNFGTVNVLISKKLDQINAIKIYYFFMLFSTIYLLPWIISQGKGFFHTCQLKLHISRAFVEIICTYFLFVSLQLLPTVDAILIKDTFPLFIPIFATIVLREKVPLFVWPFLLTGFYGTYLVIGPFDADFSFTHFYPLLSAVGFAYSTLATRRLLQYDTLAQTVYSLNLIVLLVLTPLILFTWHPLSLEVWGYLAVCGLLVAIGQILYVQAFMHSMPGQLAPYIFFELVVVYFILRTFFEVTLTTRELIGGGFIIASMMIVFWLTKRKEELA